MSGREEARIDEHGGMQFRSGTLNPELRYAAPPSIGDVQNDGITDLVVVVRDITSPRSLVQVFRSDYEGDILYSFSVLGEEPQGPASLADLDGNGTLEILLATDAAVHAFVPGSSELPGFPLFISGGSAPVTVENVAGDARPELFCVGTDALHQIEASGGEALGYPRTIPDIEPLVSPLVLTGALGSPVVAHARRSSRPRNYLDLRLASNPVLFQAGWPTRTTFANSYPVMAARGDLDGDGNQDLVFVGDTQVFAFDLQVAADPGLHWSMLGAEAQRTSCYNCVEDLVTAGPRTDTGLFFALDSGPWVRGSARFSFRTAAAAEVEWSLYDLRGRRVRAMAPRHHPGGPGQIVFDGRDDGGKSLSRGTYFARLTVREDGRESALTARLVWLR